MNKTKGIIILNADNLDKVYPLHLRVALEEQVDFIASPHTSQMVLAHPEILNEVEVIFSSWGMVVLDEALLHHAPNLKVVFYGAGSIRSFTTPAFWTVNSR